jgi:hypothetical protein
MYEDLNGLPFFQGRKVNYLLRDHCEMIFKSMAPEPNQAQEAFFEG